MNEIQIMPMVALRGLVLFPDMLLHFDVGRSASVAAVKHALKNNTEVFIVAQRDIMTDRPEQADLYETGTVARVRQVVRVGSDSDTYRVVVEGIHRAKLQTVLDTDSKYCEAKVQILKEPQSSDDGYNQYLEAILRLLKESFSAYCRLSGDGVQPLRRQMMAEKDAGRAADGIAANVFASIEKKQEILEIVDKAERAERCCVLLNEELEIISLERRIQDTVRTRMDKNQNEYYLREQLKAIYEELGEDEDPDSEKDKYLQAIELSNMPEQNKEKLRQEVIRLSRMQSNSPDSSVSRTYIEKCLELPWGIYTKDRLSPKAARAQLDKDHYGLDDVKQRIVELIAVRSMAPDIKGQIICLVGPPGVGKTSIAKSIAKAMKRNYARVSLGGVHDEAEIRGHRRTYIGSIPGRIIAAVAECKSANPVILLDEVDKLAGDFRGDPASALLEVLDGEQNSTYVDHYIDMPFDLSRVLFITTANDASAIPGPLYDRMEIIELGSYTREEKFNIAKKHLIPKQMKLHSLTRSMFRITDKAIYALIDSYTREAGVRVLERNIASLCRKADLYFSDGGEGKFTADDKNITEYLGPFKYRDDDYIYDDAVGVSNGLAWTSVGGEILQIEAQVFTGTGKLELTGSLGDVMKESAKIAVSVVRARASQYGIDPDFYKTKDIHIHAPEGAVPKDGPSAGIALTAAVLSALSGFEIRGSIAMTGEVTLTGRVLPIGGLKEKSMAAYKAGISRVIIPRGNLADLEKIDNVVKEKVEFIPVRTIDEALSLLIKLPERFTAREADEKKLIVPPQAKYDYEFQ